LSEILQKNVAIGICDIVVIVVVVGVVSVVIVTASIQN